MLQELVIHDFAIIESLELSFEKGMTTLTGETGAGKSIIIDAVGLLAGGRGSIDFIRTGAPKAVLQGLFDASRNSRTAAVMATYGLAPDDGTVLLQRELFASGRNLCRINGELVNTATLRAVGETLVDIHGQNEHQQLIHPETHITLLDQYAGAAVSDLLSDFHAQYTAYQKDQAALAKKRANEQEWAQRLDMLQFQVGEIQGAQLKPNEEDELSVERDRLANYQRISDALTESYELLANEDANPLDQIGEIMHALQGIAAYGKDYEALANSVQSVYYGLQDVQGDLSREMDGQEFDANRLDEVEKRLELINQLERKYGADLPTVIAYGEKAAKELAQMTATDENEEGLDQRVQTEHEALLKLGAKLRAARQHAAKALTKAIHAQLAALYMAKTVFSVRFTPVAEGTLRPDGIDNVEFYIQTNPGEAAKPLAKIASGGELSRIMLALKTIFAETDGVTSIIFDEVDTGVSGRVAQAIASKISQIAQRSQVLCISHLPQVAAMSDHEFLIQKQVAAGRTQTKVQKLDHTGRVQEIARMLAGEEVTKLAVEHAEEMLRLAAVAKK